MRICPLLYSVFPHLSQVNLGADDIPELLCLLFSIFKNLNDMEQVVDNVMDVLGICGMKYHKDLKEEFGDG